MKRDVNVIQNKIRVSERYVKMLYYYYLKCTFSFDMGKEENDKLAYPFGDAENIGSRVIKVRN